MLNRFATTSSVLGLLICLLSARESNGQLYGNFGTHPSQGEYRFDVTTGRAVGKMGLLFNDAGRASLPAYPTVHSETTLGALPRCLRGSQ
jgi:hypothetical protein